MKASQKSADHHFLFYGKYKYISILVVIFFFFHGHLAGQKHSFTEEKMGSPFTITLDIEDISGISIIVKNSFNLVDSMNNIFSDYNVNSELSRINSSPSGSWLDISSEVTYLLYQGQKACKMSGGKFDITLGKLTKAWRKAKKTGIEIGKDTIKYYKQNSGCKQYTLNIAEKKLWKNNSVFHFDVGGIAKGYIAEKVSKNLKENGFPRHLIDAGGDLVAGDAPTNAEGWRIAVELPQSDIMMAKSLLVQNQAVATSGSTYQYYNHGSKRHSHIIDPAKGEGISKTDNVTIISPSGADADWLATACSILSFKKSKKLIGLVPHSTMMRTFIREGKIMTMMAGKKVKFTD